MIRTFVLVEASRDKFRLADSRVGEYLVAQTFSVRFWVGFEHFVIYFTMEGVEPTGTIF